MKIDIYPQIILKNMLYLVSFLLLANILGITAKFYFGYSYVFGLISLFDFNSESNIPTLYSSFSLIVASTLLWLISVTQKALNKTYIPWMGLAIIFLFLSIDEIASIHERLITPVRESLGVSGFFFYAWVIPYGIALIVLAAIYFKFIINLPKRIMHLFMISGAVFVSGSIGCELLSGRHAELYGTQNFIFAVYYTCEELLEMIGIVIFIYSLLTYIASQPKLTAIYIRK